MMADVNLIAVPYRAGSGPTLTDLMAGQVQVTFDPLVSSIEFIRSGKLRALAVTSATRSDMLPDVPAMSEFLPGYRAEAWLGIGAPRTTPSEIVQILNKGINAAIADPKTKARFADLTLTPLAGSSADFVKFIAEEAQRWGKIIRAANIKVE